jgi:hypothetical protein
LRSSGDVVTEEATDIGVDLWVTLNLEDKEGHREFGAELKGGWTAMDDDHANNSLYPSMQKMLQYGPFALPVVLFHLTMENNEGWYTWAAEPVVSSGAASRSSSMTRLPAARLTLRRSMKLSKRLIGGTMRSSPRLAKRLPRRSGLNGSTTRPHTATFGRA